MILHFHPGVRDLNVGPRNMKYGVALILAVLIASAIISCRRAPTTAFDPPRGTWEIQSIDSGGGPQDRRPLMLIWNSMDLFMLAPTGEKKVMGRIARVDETKKPAEIDLERDGIVGFGIFEVTGNSMKLIIANPGDPRPREFRGQSEAMLFIVTAVGTSL